MFTVRWAVVAALLGGATASAAAALPPGAYTEFPPGDLGKLLDRLRTGDAKAIEALGARDDAAPYLRQNIATTTNDAWRRDYAKALAPIEARAFQRNKKRYEQWVAGGRLDLCAELLAVTRPNKSDATALADVTIPLRLQVATRFADSVGLYTRGYKGKKDLFRWPVFEGNKFFAFESGAELSLPPDTGTLAAGTLVLADRCTTRVFCRDVWFVAARTELRELVVVAGGQPGVGEWSRCVVLVNNNTQLPRATESLLVCDGDIELTTGLDRCVVIANGNIWTEKWGGSELGYFAATGNITFPNQRKLGKSVFHAGGNVTLAGDFLKPSDQIRENQKCLPFGVRFLDPAEFGLELSAPGKGGVPVKGVAPDSVFAKYDVRAGDVITHADSTPVASVAEFRRKLRTGVVRESLTLTLTRDGKTITRIVFLDGVPVPTAPAPRPK